MVKAHVSRVRRFESDGASLPVYYCQTRCHNGCPEASSLKGRIDADRFKRPRTRWNLRQRQSNECREAWSVQRSYPLLRVFVGGRGIWGKERGDCANLFIHDYDAVVEGVVEIESLDFFKAFSISVCRNRPSCPWVRVKCCGEDQRCGIKV
ncbi:hypothetical protein GCM10009628_12820 [Paeniglutamicibacter kerguelensis]